MSSCTGARACSAGQRAAASAAAAPAATRAADSRWWAELATRARPKLDLSNPGDADELEADRVADRVMRQPEPGAGCSACAAAAPTAGARGGQPLDAGTRCFFEPRLGADLAGVRVHTHPAAAQAARELGAQAFTLGADIAFARGRYAPRSGAGRRLLAHELAHVLQPPLPARLRRAASDFEIHDLAPSHAADPARIFFDIGDSHLDAGEQAKIAAFATPVAAPLTLHGYASEEGAAAVNVALVQRRIAAVDGALQRAGHRGPRTAQPHPADSFGAIDYRQRRAVEIARPPLGSTGPAPPATDPCGAPGAENAAGADLAACNSAIATVAPAAVAIANRAEADVATAPTAAGNAEVATLFPGVARADVDANLKNVAAQVRRVATQFRCASDCDPSCTRPAANLGAGAGASITICPAWVGAGADFQTYVFIHEAAHGSVGPATIDDISYADSRLVRFLSPADAVRNTDSYVLLMRRVQATASGGVAPPIGPAAADAVSGTTTAADRDAVLGGVAWLESWLNYGGFDTGEAYGTVHAALNASAWPAADPGPFNRETVHELALAFAGDLTDPGAAAPFVLPRARDRVHLAALHDRYSQMYDTVNRHALTVVVSATAPEGWAALPAIPRLQRQLVVAPAYLGLAPPQRVQHLMRLMAGARSDIGAARVDAYVDGLDRIRRHRGLGPT